VTAKLCVLAIGRLALGFDVRGEATGPTFYGTRFCQKSVASAPGNAPLPQCSGTIRTGEMSKGGAIFARIWHPPTQKHGDEAFSPGWPKRTALRSLGHISAAAGIAEAAVLRVGSGHILREL
jgi:hypothetical protein